MAELLTRSNLLLPSSHAYLSFSPHRSSSRLGFSSLRLVPLRSSSSSDLDGQKLVIHGDLSTSTKGFLQTSGAQMSLVIGKAQRWWQKGLQPNMKEVESAQDLVDTLLAAGEKVVVVDFFSPGCRGCKPLHPKVCQFAQLNPDVLFLQVNYEEHKSMCYSLNVHVLPFFRFYRGAQGRLCSFSCTNATIKKFRDALAKHSTDRCSLGPARGLEESELLALATNRDLSFSYTPKTAPASPEEAPVKSLASAPRAAPLPSIQRSTQESEDKALVAAGR
ncbi:thioredoxin-like 1-1, chloroplastic [Aristolochia californica]|uniref:thioredoxin-like 1-1, chloroplastic n=1 Tax=Aristolochia californica TaxID=171875 RepID=UPI0035D6DD48